jgi:hypothetical protein
VEYFSEMMAITRRQELLFLTGFYPLWSVFDAG